MRDNKTNTIKMKKLSQTLCLLLAILLLLPAFYCPTDSVSRSSDTGADFTLRLSDTCLYPIEVQKLMKAYPAQVKDYKDGFLIFQDGSQMVFDDGLPKSYIELLDNPDPQDMFAYAYPKERMTVPPDAWFDPGRIRNEEFFKKIYGQSTDEVQKYITEIVWCPKTVNQTLKVTTINSVDKQFLKISEQLDAHPEWEEYIRAMGVGFNWRVVAGTDRISAHSYGIALDLSRTYSDYWLRDNNTTDESVPIAYKNRFLLDVVEIFEQHGFIWGGKWYHYDTMHFEYRPELLVEL